MTESELQVAVADYLRLRYPNVLFHSDFGSGIKLIQKLKDGPHKRDMIRAYVKKVRRQYGKRTKPCQP